MGMFVSETTRIQFQVLIIDYIMILVPVLLNFKKIIIFDQILIDIILPFWNQIINNDNIIQTIKFIY